MNDDVEITLQTDDVSVDTVYVADYILPTASANTLGGVKIGDNLSISSNGVLSVPKATGSSLGVVKAGEGISIDSNGVISANGDGYVLPEATKNTLGGVYVDDALSTSSAHPVQNSVVSLSIASLYGDLNTLDGNVDDLDLTVGNLSTTVGNISTTINNMSVDISNNTYNIQTNADDIVTLGQRCSDIEDDVTALGNGANEMSGNLQALATSVLYQKKLSIYGDSISTYVGWIPEGNNSYYNGSNAGVTSVEDTWWKKVINALGLNLLVNNSWGGRTVSSYWDATAGYKQSNIDVLGSNGTPDIIFIKLGINDFNHDVTLGTYDGTAPYSNDPSKFSDAYGIMLNNIMTTFPNAKVYCCTLMKEIRSGFSTHPTVNNNGDSLEDFNNRIRSIANSYGATVLEHANCGITEYNMSSYAGDYNSGTGTGLHPNAEGMSLIANETIHELDNAIRTRF